MAPPDDEEPTEEEGDYFEDLYPGEDEFDGDEPQQQEKSDGD